MKSATFDGSVKVDYVHRHDIFYNRNYNMKEFDPFNQSQRLIIVVPPKFLCDYVNIGDYVLNSFASESVRDIIRNRYIL